MFVPARSRKLVAAAVAVAVAAGLTFGVFMLSRLAPIGTAYAAKTLCSGVFVSGRDEADVVREDILADNHPLLHLVQPTVDREGRFAAATFAGFARREAQFRPGLGCYIVIGAPSATTRVATAERDPLDPVPTPPRGSDALQAALANAFTELEATRLRRTRAVVVLHDGHLVAERYAPGFSADTPLPGWSMAKTVTAALIGTLVQAGKLKLDQQQLVPEWRSPGDERGTITLDQLLRMTSGLHFKENYGDPVADVALMLFARASAAAYAIRQPLDFTPGTHWQYSSGTTNILTRILRDSIGGTTEDYLSYPKRALFDRIGMQRAVMETDASDTFVGSSFLYATARDWAQLGQLLLQDGVWNDERILPEGWVRYMATVTPQSTRRDFGAHLWLKVPPSFTAASEPKSSLPDDTFHSVGYEGQFVSVIPSRKLVVVRLGLSRGDHVWDQERLLADVVRAITD